MWKLLSMPDNSQFIAVLCARLHRVMCWITLKVAYRHRFSLHRWAKIVELLDQKSCRLACIRMPHMGIIAGLQECDEGTLFHFMQSAAQRQPAGVSAPGKEDTLSGRPAREGRPGRNRRPVGAGRRRAPHARPVLTNCHRHSHIPSCHWRRPLPLQPLVGCSSLCTLLLIVSYVWQ